MLKRFSGALLLSGIVFSAQAQQTADWDSVEITSQHIAGNVHMIQGRGGNIGVSAGEDGVYLVDDQFAPLTERILAKVREISDGPVRFVLNTHWHGDHTGGNENLGNAGVVIVAHDNVYERMSTDQMNKIFGRTTPASPKAALPTITFNQTTTFHLNGEEIHAFRVSPSHTDGDTVVFFKSSNVIHMGDTFFNGRFPFIDTESGGRLDGVISTADLVLSMTNDATKIIPGHGPLAGREELTAYRDTLIRARNELNVLIAEGKSLEDILAARPFEDLYQSWGGSEDPPVSFITIAYYDLSGKTFRQ